METAFHKNAHRCGSITLKTGAPVIFMKNDASEYLVNGSRGKIVGFAVEGAWGTSEFLRPPHVVSR